MVADNNLGHIMHRVPCNNKWLLNNLACSLNSSSNNNNPSHLNKCLQDRPTLTYHRVSQPNNITYQSFFMFCFVYLLQLNVHVGLAYTAFFLILCL
jgi:hypothetical protein